MGASLAVVSTGRYKNTKTTCKLHDLTYACFTQGKTCNNTLRAVSPISRRGINESRKNVIWVSLTALEQLRMVAEQDL